MGESIEERIERLHAGGIVDLHFDLLMDLYEKRDRRDVLDTDFLDEFRAGGIGVVGAAIYLEDHYLSEMGLRVALDQIARLYREVEQTNEFAICKSCDEIMCARERNQIPCSSPWKESSHSGPTWICCTCFTNWVCARSV